MEHKNSFQRFTERARKILSLAQEEAIFAQRSMIGTEHILLAIAREEQGVAARVLARMGADIEKLRAAMHTVLAENISEKIPEKQREKIGFDEHALRVLNGAINEAQSQHHYYISTEHILLGLTHAADTNAARMLQSLGISLEKIRMRTASIQVLATTSSDPSVADQAADDSAGSHAHERAAPASGRNLLALCDESARRVVRNAHTEAIRYQHEYVGTEHLLLGLMHDREGAGGRVLLRLGLDQERVQRVVDQVVSPGTYKVRGAVRLSPVSSRVIEYAMREAQNMRRQQIGSEHILLSLVGNGGGIAAKMLASLGASSERVRAEVLLLIPYPIDLPHPTNGS